MKKSLTALALVALLGLTACSTETNAPDAPNVEKAAGDTKAAPSESAKPKADEPKKSPRGNTIKEIGEGAGIYDIDTKEQLVTFSVNSIDVDPVCTGSYVSPAENGHLIALDVAIETFPALGESDWPMFSLSPYTMKVVAPNGTTSNADLGTMAAYSCLADGEAVRSDSIGPAEKVTGKIIIDSEVPAGTLIITQGGLGWEYTFGEATPNA